MTDSQTLTIKIRPSAHSGDGVYIVKLKDLAAARWANNSSGPDAFIDTGPDDYLQTRFCASEYDGAWGSVQTSAPATRNGEETKIEITLQYLCDKELVEVSVFENNQRYGIADIAEMSATELLEKLGVTICMPEMDYDGAVTELMWEKCTKETRFFIENRRLSSDNKMIVLYILLQDLDKISLDDDSCDFHSALCVEIDAALARQYLRKAVMTNDDYRKCYGEEKHIFAKLIF